MLTISDLKKFYDSWYRPEKMILVLVGDFDAKLAATLIDKGKFSSIIARAPPVTVPDVGDINHIGIKPFYHFEKESGNTTVKHRSCKKSFHQSPILLTFKKSD